jgi:hypothetical protein
MLFACAVAAPAAPCHAIALPTLSEYALLGGQSVTLGRRVRVHPGSVGTLGGVVTLGSRVDVAGSVAADTVVLRHEVSTGRLYCRLVQSAHGSAVPGPGVQGSPLPLCLTFTPPLVDPTLLPPVVALPGNTPLRVPPHTGTGPTPPGSFGDVVVGAGSLLQLAGGSYQARSLTVGADGRVVCTAACDITVAVAVILKRRAQLGAATTTAADKVRIDVLGDGVAPAFRARPHAVVAATIYAPAADIVLGARGSYRGAYVGRSVRVGARADVRADSAL